MSPARPVRLRVHGGLDAVLSASVLGGIEAAVLKDFLAERRWFGSKGREPRSARIREVVALTWGEPRAAIARLEVDLGDGRLEYYQVPLMVRDSGLGTRDSEAAEPSPESRVPSPDSVLASVEADGAFGVLFDAVEDPAFRAQLREAIASGAAFESEGARWSVELTRAGAAALGDEMATRLLSAEQSNTSIIFGDRAILKLFRKLERGEHPEAEVAQFLSTRTLFRNTPELFGIIRYRDAGNRESTAGMLQRYLPRSGDAWSHALARARDYVGARDDGEPPNPFAEEAVRLGSVTRALHEALASDSSDAEFAPQPAGALELEHWAFATRRSVEHGLSMLESAVRAKTLLAEQAADACVLLERRRQFLERIDAIARALCGDAGARIRHHGDYHLGQVLRTESGEFFIIDFEGEPARPLAERRERHSALRDVAGMLRSFAYASATAAMQTDPALGDKAGARRSALGGTRRSALGVRRSAPPPRRAASLESLVPSPESRIDTRAATWEREAGEAFLDGYMGSGLGTRNSGLGPPAPASRIPNPAPAFLPRALEDIARLLELFEIEKVFYELAYELNNRPGWVWIPLRGISRLV